MRVSIVKCDCLEFDNRKPGIHDGLVGDVVGRTPQGHTCVDFDHGRAACRAREVLELQPPPPPRAAFLGGADG